MDFAKALLLLCVGCHRSSAPAAAAADASAPPAASRVADAAPDVRVVTDADRSAARAALAAGRKLAAHAEWDKAVSELEGAAQSDPTDVAVAGELTWAAIHARDLARAEKASANALALPSSGAVRAQILYNAGHVAQARGDEAAAGKLYRESIALRPNAQVSLQLGTLGVVTPRASEPFESPSCTRGARASVVACLRSDESMLAEKPRKVTLSELANGFVLAEIDGTPRDGASWCTNLEARVYQTRGAVLVHVATLEDARCLNHTYPTAVLTDVRASERDIGGTKTTWIEWSVKGSYWSGPGDSAGGATTKSLLVCVPSRSANVCPFSHVLDDHRTTGPAGPVEVRPPTDTVRVFHVEPRGAGLHVSLREGDADETTAADLGDWKL